LRLLYLIFLQLVNLLWVLGRSSASKDVELLVLRLSRISLNLRWRSPA
jgi:hypothetical protein